MAKALSASALIVVLAAPAQAHTAGELEAWETEWQARLPLAGLSLNHPLYLELLDMQHRHDWYFFPDSRPPVNPTNRAIKPVPPDRGMGTNVEQWRDLVAVYFGAQTENALCVMLYESGGNPSATNRSSGAAGLFQHLPKYWVERSTAAGWAGADIYDPTANVAVAAWLQSTGGWGHWSAWTKCA